MQFKALVLTLFCFLEEPLKSAIFTKYIVIYQYFEEEKASEHEMREVCVFSSELREHRSQEEHRVP